MESLLVSSAMLEKKSIYSGSLTYLQVLVKMSSNRYIVGSPMHLRHVALQELLLTSVLALLWSSVSHTET